MASVNQGGLIGKVSWRIRFLRDPVAWFFEQPHFRGLEESPLRAGLTEDLKRMSLRERAAFVSRPDGRGPNLLDHLLLRRLREAADGEPYFDLYGTRIFFRPDYPVADESAMLQGVLLILKEAFADRCYFFTPEVSIDEGDTVLDLGGNLGTSAMLFSRLVGPRGRVHSFEPIFHRVLGRNLRENGVGNVEVVPLGVADAPGEIEFAVSDAGIDSRIACPAHGAIRNRRPVRLTSLDDYVEREGIGRVDFIKMDIEGAEELALRGARRVIGEFRPKLTIASYHTDPTGEPQHPKLVRHLDQLGYQIREVDGTHIYAWR